MMLPQSVAGHRVIALVTMVSSGLVPMRAATSALLISLACSASAEVRLETDLSPEFPQETAALVAATAELFDAVEAAPKSDRGFSFQISATPAALSKEAGVEAFNQMGPVDHLTGYRISWYPVDRFLGSVDFMGTWDGNRNLVCGYVLWDLSDPDAPALESVVANYVEVAELADAGMEEAHIALLDANCAYGDIDLNYTVFD